MAKRPAKARASKKKTTPYLWDDIEARIEDLEFRVADASTPKHRDHMNDALATRMITEFLKRVETVENTITKREKVELRSEVTLGEVEKQYSHVSSLIDVNSRDLTALRSEYIRLLKIVEVLQQTVARLLGKHKIDPIPEPTASLQLDFEP